MDMPTVRHRRHEIEQQTEQTPSRPRVKVLQAQEEEGGKSSFKTIKTILANKFLNLFTHLRFVLNTCSTHIIKITRVL